MSWRDSQRFMRIASTVRGVGWTLTALIGGIGTYAVLESHQDDALGIIRITVLLLILVLGITHTAAWLIERHAERVVVR